MIGIAEDSLRRLTTIRQALVTDRQINEEPWREVTQNINPLLDNWDNDNDPTKKGQIPNNMKEIFDNSAIKASNKLADGIMGYAFNRDDAWFRLAHETFTGTPDPGGDWLQQAEDHCYRQLSRSSFYDEGRTFIKMCADYGTSVMVREEDPITASPVYMALHIKRVYLDQDKFGNCDVLIYKSWKSAQSFIQMFTESSLPEVIKTAYSQNSTRQYLLWHYIIPFNKYDLDISGREKRRDTEYYSLYVADIDPCKPLSEKTFRKKPFYAWRWSRSLDGGVWGTDSPGLIELSNIKQLQGMSKDFNRSVGLAARPPIKATEELKGRIKFVPEGITYLGEGEDFVTQKVVADLAAIDTGIQRVQKSVEQSYMTEFFLMLTANIERMKTATEVEGLQGEQAAMLAAFYGRLVYEFLEPAVEDLIEGEIMAGRLELPAELEGRQVNVDMISPLAQLQKRKLRLSTTDQAMREIIAISQYKQDILDNFDLDQYARAIADTYNMNKKIVRDMIDVERMRQARIQAQQQEIQRQASIEQGVAEADAYGKLAKAPEGGSPAEKAMGGKK